MSIHGRITVDALFHDRSGDERLKVLSLASSTGHTTGKVAIITGTAGTAGVQVTWYQYRDAAGNLSTIDNLERIVFAWSGDNYARCDDIGNSQFAIQSKENVAATTIINPNSEPTIYLTSDAGTGTYTVIMWGAS